MMIIRPPELLPYEPDRYYRDLEFRQQIDDEKIGERQLRLALLFNPDITYEIDN